MKKRLDVKEFVNHLRDGMSIMVGGFMTCGTPEKLVDLIVEAGVKDLTVICNDAGYPNQGVGKLIHHKLVKKLIASHIGLNPEAQQQMNENELEVILVPQGTLVEQIRAAGMGLGGVLTKTGLGTIVAEGKEVIEIDGESYLLEKPLKADIALINGSKVDHYGNVFYQGTTRNFNPLMAMACDKVFVWGEEIVPMLDPNIIVTPHVLVDYVLTEVNYG